MPFIDGMLVQSSGSRLHVVSIMEALAKQFPYTIWKIGGMVPRTTRTGGYSAHSTGRAIDIYLDAGDPLDRNLGDLLFAMFHRNATALKVDHEIWNSRIWSQSEGGPRAYAGGNGPHTNHIHVAFLNEPLTARSTQIVGLCKQVHDQSSSGVGGDRAAGVEGKAFDPRRPNVRLTRYQRYKIKLENMGMEATALSRKEFRATQRAP